MNINGYIIVNTGKTVIRRLCFIIKPLGPNGIIMKFNELQMLYLENGSLMLTNTETVEDRFVKLNNDNDIQIILEDKKYNIYINRKKLISVNYDKLNLKGQIQIGDSSNGFTGGIQDILINDE